MKTPLGYFADRFELSPRALRWSTTAALIVSIIIVFTGGLVRVTGSGLGCPTWPACTETSLLPGPELGIHGIIEFANRMFTTVIVVAVGWVIVAARLQRPRVRWITRLAWSQFWLVVANAIAGGITVLVELNPWVVAMHFVLAIALLATTTFTWHRVHEDRTFDPRPATSPAPVLSWALAISTAVLVVLGTLVSGSGPHSGDSADVPRMQLDWTAVTVVHGVAGTVVLVLSVLLWFLLRGGGRDRLARSRVSMLLLVLVAQGAIGVIQAIIGLPEALVSLHLLGAALVWVGALRVLLDVNPGLFAPATTPDPSLSMAGKP